MSVGSVAGRRLAIGCWFLASQGALAVCVPGVYGLAERTQRVVVASVASIPLPGQRYRFVDGRRGLTADPQAAVVCDNAGTLVRSGEGPPVPWPRIHLKETPTTFTSAATTLAGSLIEPEGEADTARPLVVMVHGSERTAAIGSPYAYALAAQGLSVFVYDKRGTGASGGVYTQNFELLADDAAAAFRHAAALAQGRHGRAGYFGGSQGGWVAPLAATRTPAQFVAVGFGLAGSPIDEDREQLLAEARAAGLNARAVASIHRLSKATARILRSRFSSGFSALEALRRELKGEPWVATIQGEHSGDMLRMNDADLRRIGRARFDNLELIWDHDAGAVLRRLRAPLLWVLAEQDREAPPDMTRRELLTLTTRGSSVDVFQFPDTDHGMFEFVEAPDGSRRYTRITDGYLRLLADWIAGTPTGSYGRSRRLR